MNHTVRVIIFLLAITAIIVFSGIYSQNILNFSSGELEKSITAIESCTASNDWENAKENLDKVMEKWQATKKTWSVLIDHQEIDNIDITLSRMDKFIQCKDTSSALAEASALIKYVKHIPKKEAPGIENIF